MDKNKLIQKLKEEIENSDYILIGAGAGLSTSAGFLYDGKRFEDNFKDYIKKYGFTDMYSAGFYNFPTLEEYWAYFSLYVYINRYDIEENETYLNLYNIVKNKNYFVITTNVDGRFADSKFDKDKIFAVQGDFSLFQCSKPCRQETFYNEKYIREMIKYKKEMKIPTELIPKCPYCGRNMSMNLRADSTFVQDKNWDKQKSKYEKFLKNSNNSKILFLELGVGFNTPSIIKYNFWRMTLNNKKSVYASINLGECYGASNIEERSICIDADISEVLKKLIK
ncbi:Sir2 silent information regulator family NAD-dependent deacetylase [Brachyspira aalborgi]|uniref:Sir2 silent information regulator family NAD-dependent deacetylase n=1 Tax=Brachyspira aalborgi TaxID=29522 RepID=A0A5C8ENR2_9SPIR|nr:Sir2 silent information regulator family NAD-dependent deacetylase [Brachyspira aalborgi]TXJ38422.1 Sir2 silent information regulator family NAD-dependent deacetylase [Brachyspira aalborgi]TXJ52126.1 Sir2 silent information regulator family NAD-dependent deacetylase [Brachyspira aalborgi]